MFERAFLKIKWAYTHFENIERAFNGLGKSNDARFIIGKDADSGTQFLHYYIGNSKVTNFPLMIGDCIHNLRSSLDHAMWELIGLDRGTQDRNTAFPFARTQSCYETMCKGIKTSRSDTKKFFLSVEAFEGGKGSLLYGLNRLSILDKHVELAPVITLVELRKVQITHPNGQCFTGEFLKPQIDESGVARIYYDIPADCRIECDNDSYPTMDIHFGKAEMFEHEPILETLIEVYSAVSCTICDIRDFVSSRNP